MKHNNGTALIYSMEKSTTAIIGIHIMIPGLSMTHKLGVLMVTSNNIGIQIGKFTFIMIPFKSMLTVGRVKLNLKKINQIKLFFYKFLCRGKFIKKQIIFKIFIF
jgi:hypothetical protein